MSKITNQSIPPLAYQRGYQDFYGRDFIVTPDVLIPRPETEQIIDATLNLAGKPYLPGIKPSKRQLPLHPIILDVGTGSGCIAITLALELPEATIFATDISEKALQIAQKNAKTHGARITTIISHLLEKVNTNKAFADTDISYQNSKIKSEKIPTPDLIIANLPYVDKNWNWLDKTNLGYEPSIALYAKDGGLALIKQLVDESSLRQIKYLILEADPCQHQAIINYAKANCDCIDRRGFIITLQYHPLQNSTN